MTVLRYLAGIFVDTFGITRPPRERRDGTARYISFLLVLLLLMLFGTLALVVHVL